MNTRRTHAEKEALKGDVEFASTYAVLLESVNTYEQLLKDEGWGEPRNASEKLGNVARYCGFSLPTPQEGDKVAALEKAEQMAREEIEQSRNR